MKTRLVPLAGIALFAAVACGEIQNPTAEPAIAVVTLNGSVTGGGGVVPSGLHVALVFRVASPPGLFVAGNAVVEDAHFSLALPTPEDRFFSEPPFGDARFSPFASAMPTAGSPPVLNGQLQVAAAGFLVYRDGNGNGRLDLDRDRIASGDEVRGGSTDVVLAYLRGGSDADYDALPKAGGSRPDRGYDLVTRAGYSPLSSFQLQLALVVRLPDPICYAGWGVPEFYGFGVPPISCSPDGRSYTAWSCDGPLPPSLCNGAFDVAPPDPSCRQVTNTLGQLDNPGWPCNIAGGGP